MTGCPVAVATVKPTLALVSPAAEAVIVNRRRMFFIERVSRFWFWLLAVRG